MASTIKLKNGTGIPLVGDLVQGEPAFDLTNKRLYTEDAGGVVIEVGTNPSTLNVEGAATFGGNVGIGTSSPATILNTRGAILTTTTDKREILLEAYDDGVTSSLGALTGVTFRNSPTAYTAGSFNRTSGVYGINLDDAGYGRSMGLALYTSATDGTATEKMRIDAAGALTTTGAATFGGNVTAASGTGTFSGVVIGGNGTDVVSNTGELALKAPGANPVSFWTNDTTRMVLDASGNMGLGVTPSAWTAGWQVMDIKGGSFASGGVADARVYANAYYNGTNHIYKADGFANSYLQAGGAHFWYNAPSGTEGANITFTQAMTLDASGMLSVPAWYTSTTALAANAYINSGGPQGALSRSTSSIKYKRDVETMEDVYADALLDVRPVFYRSKSDKDNAAHGFWGIIAEELAEIDPRLVHWQTHVPVEVADDGGVVTIEMVELDTPEPEGVQYERFVPHLINLAKRQRDQITAQASAITSLTARLDAAGL